MADKRSRPEAPDGGRRKRATPTIDLKATKVAPADAASPATAATPPDPPVRNPQPEPKPVREPPSKPTPSPPPQQDPPPPIDEPPPPPEEPPAPIEEPPPVRGEAAMDADARRHSIGFGPILAAGFIGAALVTLLVGGLWWNDLLPPRVAGSSGAAAQIAALEKQIQDLQNRPAPAPAIDSESIDALRQRLTAIETNLAKLPSGDTSVAERLAAADNAMKSLELALTALERRNDDMAARAQQAAEQAVAAQKAIGELRAGMQDVAKDAADAVAPAALDALRQRVATLEQSLKSAQNEIAKAAAAGKAARLAFAAAALRDAVESGAPYDAALAQAKSFGADANAVKPLEPFARTGLPTENELARELRDLLPAMLKASGADQAPSGGFLERLQANAGKLVRIRPLDAPAGDAPADVLARIEVEAAAANIDGARADLAKLPEAARKPAAAWIAKVKARQEALAAARNVAAASARALDRS